MDSETEYFVLNNTCLWAAERGFLDIIQTLYNRGFVCENSEVANMAAEKDHLNILQFLEEHKRDNTDSIFTTDTANAAAYSGHLDIIHYLRELGIECSDVGADCAASYGHLTILEDLYNHGIQCTQNGADDAAANGHLDVIRFLHEKQNLHPHSPECAIYNGHLHILEELHSYGILYNEYDADFAAEHGHLNIVQYFRTLGINCTQRGATEAACKSATEKDSKRYSDVVEYLHEHGIDYDQKKVKDYLYCYNLAHYLGRNHSSTK